MNVIGSKKNIKQFPAEEKAKFLEKSESRLSIRRQCELLSYNRSNIYYTAHPRLRDSDSYKEALMRRLDYWNTEEPAWGVKTLAPLLANEGLYASIEFLRELRAEMGLETIYPKENTSKATKNARKLPYLLGGLRREGMIWLPNLVWAIDITYIALARTHMYLVALIDWFSRFIVGFELSDTLETAPVIELVKRAFKEYGLPAILNSDQGSQFTSNEYMELLRDRQVHQSMDGKGRWVDNVIIERWFRTLKVENIYINEYQNPRELYKGINRFVYRYNYIRPHQSLEYKTPFEMYDNCFRKSGSQGVVQELRLDNTPSHY